MSQKHTAVELQDPTGNQVRAVSQENDFPLPPVDELKKLHDFRPDLVDKIIDLTAQKRLRGTSVRPRLIATSTGRISCLPWARFSLRFSRSQVPSSSHTAATTGPL